MKIDIFAQINKVPNQLARHLMVDKIMERVVPFNRGMGFKVKELSQDLVKVVSPNKKRRQNHLGGAHACALALLGEYPAGLLLGQNYSLQSYRLILSELHMDYKKQGRGELTAVAEKNEDFPKVIKDEAWFDMTTNISNSKGETVAICTTKWQLKSWDLTSQIKS